MGMVQTGYTARWLVLGRGDYTAMGRSTLIVWLVLHVLNAAVALGILYTWRNPDFAAGLARARQGLAMWLVVAACCVGATLWTV